MADSKLSALTNNTSPADDDILYLVDDPGGTPADNKVTVANLLATQHDHTLADVTDVTASAAEVNILDGATLTTTELNYVDGVTSAIQTQLDGKAATSHTQAASTITDFDTEVSNNTDVAANTAARHAALTVTDSSEIDFTLTGQDLTASLKAGSIDETKLDTSTNASLDLADSAVQDLADLGITATASELNTLDGITATVTELNYVDGVTSAIQTQLDGKVDENSAITGATKTKITYDAKGLVTAGADATFDDFTDGTTNKAFTSTLKDKLDGIETSADVTDATNVAAAGAVMESDTSTASMSFVIDEDNMASDSATKVPTQQSVKAYVDANAGGGASDFTDLGDVPSAYTSQGEKFVAVKADETGLEFVDAPSGGGGAAGAEPFIYTLDTHSEVAGYGNFWGLATRSHAGGQLKITTTYDSGDSFGEGGGYSFSEYGGINLSGIDLTSGSILLKNERTSSGNGSLYYRWLTNASSQSVIKTDTNHQLGIKSTISGGGTDTVYSSTGDGTTATNTTLSGVSLVESTSKLFNFERTSSDVKFYVNGVLKSTHTTNLPTVSTSTKLCAWAHSANTGVLTSYISCYSVRGVFA